MTRKEELEESFKAMKEVNLKNEQIIRILTLRMKLYNIKGKIEIKDHELILTFEE